MHLDADRRFQKAFPGEFRSFGRLSTSLFVESWSSPSPQVDSMLPLKDAHDSDGRPGRQSSCRDVMSVPSVLPNAFLLLSVA
jgi:hypothetical protein